MHIPLPLAENISGTVEGLPVSKSIYNRLLILQKLYAPHSPLEGNAHSDDTQAMAKALSSDEETIDIGHAGTAMRFLTAYFAVQEGRTTILTGSERMKQRPIKVLVDALRKLGADIEYVGTEGCPPLKIKGKKLQGGKLEIDGSVSSQYISALLMIGAKLEKGLELTLTGDVVSFSYVKMTTGLIEKVLGVPVNLSENTINIKYTDYPKNIDSNITDYVEADWSGASYWYQLLALCKSGSLELPHLNLYSSQGDKVIRNWVGHLSNTSSFLTPNVKIDRTLLPREVFIKSPWSFLDFTECPDIAQTIVVLSVLLGRPFKFSGLQTLRIKETDRIKALQDELGKLGADIKETEAGVLEWDGSFPRKRDEKIIIKTYHDHRMAMAFAPVAMLLENVWIEDPMVVTKSYPKFWDDIENIFGKYYTLQFEENGCLQIKKL